MTAHAVLAQLFYSGAWNFLTPGTDLLSEATLKTRRGMSDDGEITPGKMQWRFNNQSDKWRPTNPSGPLYGLLKRNMPAAVSIDSLVAFAGEIVSFSPNQSEGFTLGPPARGMRWVDMSAQGQLARISSWDDPLRSAMYQRISSYAGVCAWLPFEDPVAATAPLNAAPGGYPAYSSGVQYAAGDGPGGAGTATAMSATSRAGVPVLGMSSTAGWQVVFSFRLDAAAPSGTALPLLTWTMANGYTYYLGVNDTTFRLLVTTGDATVLIDNNVTFGAGIAPTDWLTFRVKVTQSGGNVSVERAWYNQSGTPVYGTTNLFAGTVSRPTNIRINGNSTIDGALYNHVVVLSGVGINLASTDAIAAFNGYAGELAANRFVRLMGQIGFNYQIVGSTSDSWPMGPQRPDTLINVLADCKDTEDGLIFERKAGLGLVFRTRKSLTNQTAKLTLAYAGDIVPELAERLDVADVRNEITVTDESGATAVASLTVGPLSNLPAPDGIGSKKGSKSVNVSDPANALTTLAGWYVSRLTQDGARYDTVTIDLDKSPSLITDVNGTDIGDRIVITGRDPEPIDLIVYAIDNLVTGDKRIVTFTCVPGEVYKIGVYDAATSRYDVKGSTLGAAVTTTATSWTVTAATIDDLWSTTAGTPGSNMYEWIIRPAAAEGPGERVRVTAMGAATGTGPFSQTATVVRSVNGVVVAHAAGETIHMAPRTDSTPGAVRYAI